MSDSVERQEAERVEIFRPVWKGAVEGWAVNFIHRNLWKVTPEYDFDDLYQDAFTFFLVCRDRYPEVVDPPHFMRLFQTCVRNHVIDLAARRTRRNVIDGGPEGVKVDDLAGKPVSGGIDEVEARELVEDACGPLARLLEKLVLADVPPPFLKNGVRETTVEYLQRLAEVGGEVPIVEMIFSWIRGERVQRAAAAVKE